MTLSRLQILLCSLVPFCFFIFETCAQLAGSTAWGAMEGKLGGKRSLVLVDVLQTEATHSIFLDQLRERGHILSIQLASSPTLPLTSYGAPLYDNILLMAPEWNEDGEVSVAGLIEFVEAGGNMMVMADCDMSASVRKLASLSGVDFDVEGSSVVDHFRFEDGLGGSSPHTVIHATGILKNTKILGNNASHMAPVLYRGIGHAVDENNILASKILTGGPSTYSAILDRDLEKYPENIGKDTLLVTAIQGRNNARVTFTGSMAICSNRYYLAVLSDTASPSGNKEFCNSLSQWTFAEKGVLRVSNVTHHRLDGTPPELLLKQKERPDLPVSLFADPEITRNSLVYRIKDDLVYSFFMEEYDGSNWVPFHADDVQLEFVMLDPYIRKTMQSNGKGLFTCHLKAPDVYGIFKFHIMYRRTGLTTIAFDTLVSVRPFKHNEYERFIEAAYPYYSSAFTIMAGFFIFSFYFLYSK